MKLVCRNIFIFVCLTFPSIYSLYTGELNEKEYKIIVGHDYPIERLYFNMSNDSLLFKGYMVFEITRDYRKDILNDSDKFIFIRYYWINNLSDITDTSKFYHHNYLLNYVALTSNDEFQDNGALEQNNFRNFMTKLDMILANIRNGNAEKPFIWGMMNTNIFDNSNVKFWNYNDESIGYFIFKVSFYTLLLNYTYDHQEKYTVIRRGNFFFPTSKEIEFYPVPDSILFEYGFKHADWYPDNLYYILNK